MRIPVLALMSALLCTVTLAACGDSNSSTSTTSTVPSGKLGAAATECKAPTASIAFGAIQVTNVDCKTASAALLSYWKNGSAEGWTCSKTVSGRHTAATCKGTADPSQTFSGSWYRS